MAQMINDSRGSFDVIAAQNNNQDVLKGLIDFYNAKISLTEGKVQSINYKKGIQGYIMTGKDFNNSIYLGKEK